VCQAGKLAGVETGEATIGHVQTRDVAARLGIPWCPAGPKDEPRGRRKSNEFLPLAPKIPVKHAGGVLGGLDGDAAGGADGDELHGFGAGKEQVRHTICAKRHVLGSEAHEPSFTPPVARRQALQDCPPLLQIGQPRADRPTAKHLRRSRSDRQEQNPRPKLQTPHRRNVFNDHCC